MPQELLMSPARAAWLLSGEVLGAIR